MKLTQRKIPYWTLAAALAVTVGAGTGQAQAQTVAETAQERDALKVVMQWWKAWQVMDRDKMVDMVTDDIVFQGIPTDPVQKGRDAFRAHIARLGRSSSSSVPEAFAVSGPNETVTLTKRLVQFSPTAKPVPIAALVVVRDGKIAEWEDFLLFNMPARRGGAGGPPGAGPPPGGAGVPGAVPGSGTPPGGPPGS